MKYLKDYNSWDNKLLKEFYEETDNLEELKKRCEYLIDKFGKPSLGVPDKDYLSILIPLSNHEIIDFLCDIENIKSFSLEILRPPITLDYKFKIYFLNENNPNDNYEIFAISREKDLILIDSSYEQYKIIENIILFGDVEQRITTNQMGLL